MKKEFNRLNLAQVETLLHHHRVLISPEDDRNPIVIAVSLGLVGLHEVDRVETGYFNSVDQRLMLTDGLLLRPIAFGQQVLQAISIDISKDTI